MRSNSRRQFLFGSAAVATMTPLLAGATGGTPQVLSASSSPLAKLLSMTAGAKYISDAERQGRRKKLSRLLKERKVFAALIEPGSTLDYFTGVRWSLSERLTAVLITADGAQIYVTPAFEESRLREYVGAAPQIITWEEDQDPFVLLADWVKGHSSETGTLVFDEGIRYFAPYRLGEALPNWSFRSAAPEVNACRMIKSDAELALMQLANDITITAYRAVHPLVEPGMASTDVAALMQQALGRLGGEKAWGGVQVGKGSALPHGSKEPEYVANGMVVLMDFGCGVGGYRSDISRTFVFGEANDKQRRLWDLVRQGQELAFAKAQPGTAAGDVDKVVRALYESAGFGPGYQLPGLSHRLGHGIGLDVHEPINFVGNQTATLHPGMCFSNEPGIYVPGEYGVRIEDCLYITQDGPRWFSTPPVSIDEPMG